jgi:hypothetical protein
MMIDAAASRAFGVRLAIGFSVHSRHRTSGGSVS